MTKSTLPKRPTLLRTAAQRRARAKVWCKNLYLTDSELVVDVSLGSKRKNTRGIKAENVVAIHYEARIPTAGHYAIIELKDGRIIYIDWPLSISASPTATVSHDIEHLWWNGLTQRGRDALTHA